jgi:beta-galactosidase
MTKLLLFALLFSKDSIITTLVPLTPASTHLSTKAPITLRILNSSANPFKNILLEWSLQSNGSVTKKGKNHIPALAPNKPILIQLPLPLPDDSTGESFLLLRYYSTGTLLSERQLIIKPYQPRLTVPPAGEITLSDENDTFTIHSPSIRISFNRQTGWLVQYEIKGIDLLDDSLGLRSNFWWPGYNDSANYPSDSGWLAATREPHLQVFSTTNSPEQIIIRTEYTLPATTSLLHLSYNINAGGEMLITQQVEPDTSQPSSRQWPLPCFGMQWILPAGYDSITEYGPLGSGWIGLKPGYLPTTSPSDPLARAKATRTEIRWWTITDKDGNGLQFIADTPLLNESSLRFFDGHAIRINIDRPRQTNPSAAAPATPDTQPPWPALLPMGNYRYTYKVKPLVSSTRP